MATQEHFWVYQLRESAEALVSIQREAAEKGSPPDLIDSLNEEWALYGLILNSVGDCLHELDELKRKEV